MKFEIGKAYKNRLGEKVYILSLESTSLVCICEKDEFKITLREDGNFYGDNVLSGFDIVSEWAEEEILLKDATQSQLFKRLEEVSGMHIRFFPKD